MAVRPLTYYRKKKMDKGKENWQDSPQTGREANRDYNNKSEGYHRDEKRSYNNARSDYRKRDNDGERSSYQRRDSYRRDDNRYGDRSSSNRGYSNRSYSDRGYSDRNYSDRNYSDRNSNRSYSDRSDRRSSWGESNEDRRSSYNRGGYTPRYNREEGRGDSRGGYNRDNRGGGNRSYDSSRKPRYSSDRREGGYNRNEGYRRPMRRTDDYDPNAKYSKRKQIEYKQQFVDPNEPIRLNKYLANAGVCSRREADELIESGVVVVNGVVVNELGTKVKRSDEVKVNDKLVSLEKKVYVLLNKPKDCVTTMDDPQERRTVMDFVKDACDERIYPVGRLDRKTTGVLLLTNDGDLASKLTHPKYEKKKIYHVVTDRNVIKNDLEKIAEGIELEDGIIKADSIGYIDEAKRDQLGIEIHSGKNRIVRRIFESLGYRVVKLDRVLFAGLTKKGLRRGDWRYLTEQEVAFLKMGSFE